MLSLRAISSNERTDYATSVDDEPDTPSKIVRVEESVEEMLQPPIEILPVGPKRRATI
jgi:hypothetical protein